MKNEGILSKNILKQIKNNTQKNDILELKIKMNNLEPYMKEFYKNAINNERTNLKINALIAKEIINIIDSKEINKILLILKNHY